MKGDILEAHLTSHQCLNQFAKQVHEKLESHSQSIKKEFQKKEDNDKAKEIKLSKELEEKQKLCEKLKIKLKELLSQPQFGMSEVYEIERVRKIMEGIQEQIKQIEADIDDFQQSKLSFSLMNAEMDNVEHVIDVIMNHLKTDDVYANTSIASEDGIAV